MTSKAFLDAPRGPKTLLKVTFPMIAKLAQRTVPAVRQAARTGRFDRTDLESIVSYINQSRARLQLPPIGGPPHQIHPQKPTEPH